MTDVLLVDDDDGVRSTLSKMLEQGGFQVVAVDNGLAALAELHQHAVGAIVTDIAMPFLTGRRFYDELANENPAMAKRVVFVTGRYGDAEIGAMARRTGRPVLQKPVGAKELMGAVKSIIDE